MVSLICLTGQSCPTLNLTSISSAWYISQYLSLLRSPPSECLVVITITTIDALASFCVEISLFFMIPSLWVFFVGLRRTGDRSQWAEICEVWISFWFISVLSDKTLVYPHLAQSRPTLITRRNYYEPQKCKISSLLKPSRLIECSLLVFMTFQLFWSFFLAPTRQ